MGLQRRDGGARRRRQRHPAHLRRRPRDRLDADRLRRRCARPHAHQGRRMGGAEVFRAARADRQAGAAARHCGAARARRHARAPARRRARAAAPRRPAGAAAAALRCRRPAAGPGPARQHARARHAIGALLPRGCSRGCSRRGLPTRATGSTPWAGGPTPRWRAGSRRVAPGWSASPAASARSRSSCASPAAASAWWSLAARARRSVLARIADHRRHLDGCGKLLASLSYHGVLQRGYALVRDSEGRTLRSAAQVAAGQLLDIELADGHVDAQALSGGARRRPPSRSRTRAAAPPRKKTGHGGAETRGRCSDGVVRCQTLRDWRATRRHLYAAPTFARTRPRVATKASGSATRA